MHEVDRPARTWLLAFLEAGPATGDLDGDNTSMS